MKIASSVFRGRRNSRRDMRFRVMVGVLLAVISGGATLAWLSGLDRAEAERNETQAELRQIHQRFMQGVAMLHAGEYEYAARSFHYVLQLAPRMPEAHVNMGYALLGLERYGAARDFFETAIALRTRQINAYYGLAIALEHLRDHGGAVGAMRTYLHLTSSDDPYARKAQAALWEWEAALAQERGAR